MDSKPAVLYSIGVVQYIFYDIAYIAKRPVMDRPLASHLKP